MSGADVVGADCLGLSLPTRLVGALAHACDRARTHDHLTKYAQVFGVDCLRLPMPLSRWEM